MTEDTGRFYIKDLETGRTFCVEPIEGKRVLWGDINPATKELEGSYGSKYKGCIKKEDSIITKENGFKNITILKIGESPLEFIDRLIKKDKDAKHTK